MKIIVVLIPLIALLFTVIFYRILFKKSEDKKIFKQFILIISLTSFILNEIWELVQMPLYKQAIYNMGHIAFCTLAAIADMIMILLLYLGFAFIYKNPFWIRQSNWSKILRVMFVGAVGAVLSEKRHLLFGSWSYDESMPIVPFVDVGLTPFLQFFLLPVIIYFLSHRIISKLYNHTISHHINHY